MGFEIYYRKLKNGDSFDVYSTIVMSYLKRGLKSPEEVGDFLVKHLKLTDPKEIRKIRNIWIKAANKAKKE